MVLERARRRAVGPDMERRREALSRAAVALRAHEPLHHNAALDLWALTRHADVAQALRTEGVDGLLVCSASHEEDALTAISDLILDGPVGVAEWLSRLADSLGAD